MNLLNQAGLGGGIGVPLFEWRYARLYVVIAVCAAALAAIQAAAGPPFLVALALAAVASLVVLRLNRGLLDLKSTFPELRHVPLLGRLTGQGPGGRAALSEWPAVRPTRSAFRTGPVSTPPSFSWAKTV